jgi:hypothetical protein
MEHINKSKNQQIILLNRLKTGNVINIGVFLFTPDSLNPSP